MEMPDEMKEDQEFSRWVKNNLGIEAPSIKKDLFEMTKLTPRNIMNITYLCDNQVDAFAAGAFWMELQMKKKIKIEQDRALIAEQDARYLQSIIRDQQNATRDQQNATRDQQNSPPVTADVSIEKPAASAASVASAASAAAPPSESKEEIRERRAKFYSRR
jgi:hypothetical protein